MRIQDLIDKIQEIKSEAKFDQYDIKDDLESKLKKIQSACDNILIEWRFENAKCLSLTSSNEKP